MPGTAPSAPRLCWDAMAWFWMLAFAIGVLIALLVVEVVYLSMVFGWEDRQTLGNAYYGRPLAQRRLFKRALRRRATVLFPVLRLLSQNKFKFENGSFVVDGVAGPKGTCSEESFRQGIAYRPRPQDVFVATQMKCGTTWMQYLVYEVLHRGKGDLVDKGQALYSVAPWLEARKSVSLEQAPLLGAERPSRLIKTHLPAQLCPYAAEARYIYVVRHPLSCFASCVDFIATNVGAFAPPLQVIEEWFRAPQRMWWGTWPAHVTGWWERSQQRPNVLFVAFEEMKRDLAGVVKRVADFLPVAPLSEHELAEVVRKSGFAYMQEHDEAFEMHPPHILATDAELFVSGRAERHLDVPAEVKARIAAWVRAEMASSAFPLARFYPDVAMAPAEAPSGRA